MFYHALFCLKLVQQSPELNKSQPKLYTIQIKQIRITVSLHHIKPSRLVSILKTQKHIYYIYHIYQYQISNIISLIYVIYISYHIICPLARIEHVHIIQVIQVS